MAIYTTPIDRQADSNFRVGSGYKLYFFDAGTTDARDTYTDNTYATPLANPVVADGEGRFSVIWTSGDYKVRLTDASDVLIWEVDNYSTDAGSAVFAESIQSAAGSAADVITANLSTTPSELTNSLQVVVELAHGANTISNPTFNLNSLGAKTIVRDDNKPLRAGDTGGSGAKIYLAFSTADDAWVLLNPVKPSKGLGGSWYNGLNVTNGTDTEHDIDISTGQIEDSTAALVLDNKSAITKQIDVDWAEGSADGGFPSGLTLAADTWYRVFIIGKTNGATDAGFDTSSSAANLLADATDYTYYRRVGWVLTDSSSNILNWNNDGPKIYTFDAVIDEGITASTSPVATTVSVPPLQRGNFTYSVALSDTSASNSCFGYVVNMDQTTTNPAIDNFDAYSALTITGASATSIFASDSVSKTVRTNASSQVRHEETSKVGQAKLLTKGWIDDLTED